MPITIPTTAIDDDSHLGRDQPCFKCSYNLRGLPLNGVCPECGLPVQDSLKGILLKYASAEYRSTLNSGLSLLLNAILVQIVLAIASFVAMLLIGPDRSVFLISHLLGLAVSAMSFIGYYRYTEGDPGYVGIEPPRNSRQIARAMVLVLAGISVINIFQQMLAKPIAQAVAGQPTIEVFALAIGLVGVAAMVVQFVAILKYTAWMADRIPDAFIRSRARRYVWLLPLITIVGAIALMIGPLIALILYWNLLDRLRKHVRSIDATGEVASLPKMAG